VSKQFLFFDVLIQIMLCNASKQIALQTFHHNKSGFLFPLRHFSYLSSQQY